jgi:ADP-ribosylglycohydrolase
MIGAIIGDLIGSHYEFNNLKDPNFSPLWHPKSKFTDDTVCTCAIAKAILENPKAPDYAKQLRDLCNRYPEAGYGGKFKEWLADPTKGPYGSWGNGSAMRVSPVAWAYGGNSLDLSVPQLEHVIDQSILQADVTHNHDDALKGALAISTCIWWARMGKSKEIITRVVKMDYYPLAKTLDQIRPSYSFKVSCKASVPVAIIAFLESNSFEDCIRKAISVGGDSDTIAAMAGSIAHAYYGHPCRISEKKGISLEMVQKMEELIPSEFSKIIFDFDQKFDIAYPKL